MTQLESHSSRRARREAGERETREMSAPPATPPGGRRSARTPEPVQPPPAEGDPRRGSHATPLGQGFSWVIIWTIIGTVVPGSGLIAAGWRRSGWLVLALMMSLVAGLGALIFTGDPVERVAAIAVNPTKLMLLVVLIGVSGLLLASLVILTNVELRRFANLNPAQRAFSALVVVALIGGIAAPTYKAASYAMIQRDLVTSVFGNTAKPSTTAVPDVRKADPWAGHPRVNVLLLGSDAGPDRIGVRPDTMILASINTVSGDTVLFSLPRNLERVPFPAGSGGHRAWPDGFSCAQHACLLNAVWTWAAGNAATYYPGDPHPGLTATEQAVEGVTGLKPDYYAMLNLSGFQGFVNAIGGITVNVHERLPIGGNAENPGGTTGWIEPGNHQHLDGYHALWYARSRWSTSDYDRMQRQRCVIGAISSQARPVTMLQAFPALARTAKQNISTDIPTSQLEAWVTLTERVKKAQVRSLPFTDRVIHTWNPDFARIQQLVRDNLDPRPAATPATGASTAPTPRKKASAPATPSADAGQAQDVKSVC